MENVIPNKEGSYIVRDKRGTYMGGYSEKLGHSNAVAWATIAVDGLVELPPNDQDHGDK